MSSNPKALDAAIAATRFGLGARPGEIAEATGDPQGWLIAQIRPDGADSFPGASAADRAAAFRTAQLEVRDVKAQAKTLDSAGTPPARAAAGAMTMSGAGAGSTTMTSTSGDSMMAQTAAVTAVTPVRAEIRDAYAPLAKETQTEVAARAQLAMTTPAAFRERWALFWSNHFTVAGKSRPTRYLAPVFERDAIRPHVFGRFDALLFASSTHPEMLQYLDQVQSAGPNSPAMQRVAVRGPRRGAGLNENLAREIMELHTVGADGGYTQTDVTEFARALTGWGVGTGLGPDAQLGDAVFRSGRHEPGPRTVMGRRYLDGGDEQSRAILTDLASRPQTARRLARKIAAHFVSDAPDPRLVAELEAAWTRSGGDLAEVARALVRSPLAWAPQPAKLKTPYELIVSAYRAVGASPAIPQRELFGPLGAMGHQPFQAPQPNGWPDDAGAWAGPGDMVKRLQWSQAFAGVYAPAGDVAAVAQSALGARLLPATLTGIARAESRPEALALLVMSPEFQRR